jgi:hypothetical protein
MMRCVLAVAAAAALCVSVPVSAQSEVLKNETVIQLVQAGIGDDAVIAKIRTSKTEFDLSTDGLIALKQKGVPNAVIAAMLGGPAAAVAPAELSMDSADPKVPHYPGLYMMGSDKMIRINPTVSNQARTGNILGYALTMGLSSASVKAAIPGESAKVQTNNRRPVFYAYFEESVPRSLQTQGSSHWSSGNGSSTSSPNEITLVRLGEKEGRREAQVGSINIAGAKSGVMDKDQLGFETEMLSPGLFKVTLKADLAPGEYGFIQSMSGGGSQGAMTARVFDFGVE